MHVITKLLEGHCPASIAQQFLEISGGGKLPQKSIAKSRDAVLMRKCVSNATETTAETLMRTLTEDETMSFVCHTGSCDEAKKLVRVRRKRQSKGQNMTIEEKNNISEEHKTFVTEIVLGLSLGNGEFLTNVMWLDETAKRYHRLCPEVLGVDVTFRTNAEKRGLHRGCSIAIDLRNVPNVLAHAPSNQA